MTEHLTMIDEKDRDLLIAAFREMLLNAMEHGAGFDKEKVVEVTAARTARAIVYHFRDPGGGFDRKSLSHAASAPTPEEVVATAVHRAELGMRPGGFGMASVAPRVRCSAGLKMMLPTSMTRCVGSIRISAAVPTASPTMASTIA